MDAMFAWIALVGLGLLLFATMIRLRAVEKRLAALKQVDMKVAFLLKHANVTFDPFQGLPSEIVAALRDSATKIEAIVSYRKATGAGLRDAKNAIEDAIRKTGISL